MLQPLITLSFFDTNNMFYSVKYINDIVEKSTSGIVQNIIQTNTSSIISTNKCVIINAYYFYLPWKIGFPKALTKKEIFNKNINPREIEMMNLFNSKQWFYSETKTDNDIVRVTNLLELEYADSDLHFGIYLSNDANIIEHSMLQELIDKLQYMIVSHIKIPKFSKKNKYLIDELYKNILPGATLFNSADLGHMTPYKYMQINKIIHQMSITIDEEGGTNNLYEIFNSKKTTDANINMIVDNPFFYYIRHVPNNVIIICGFFD
jgi:serine protease inhibitor